MEFCKIDPWMKRRHMLRSTTILAEMIDKGRPVIEKHSILFDNTKIDDVF
jgi:hypothetical protein